MIKVTVDSKSLQMNGGSRVKDALERLGLDLAPGAVVGLLKERSLEEAEVDSYIITTTRGVIKIKLTPATPNLTAFWKRTYRKFIGEKVRWVSHDAVNLGYVTSPLTPSRKVHKYLKGEVVLGLSGFQQERTDFSFSLDDHEGCYGGPEENRGVIGKMVSGEETVEKLEAGDAITSINPQQEEGKTGRTAVLISPDSALTDGMELVSRVDVRLERESEAVDYAQLALAKGLFEVEEVSEAFIRLAGSLKFFGLETVKEAVGMRHRGTLTFRNRGTNGGKLYVYRKTYLPSVSHSVVGHVEGLELLEAAAPSNKIMVSSNPPPLFTIGLTQSEAGALLEGRGLRQLREGDASDASTVVDQIPYNTLSALRRGTVTTVAVPSSDIVEVEFYEAEAPITSTYLTYSASLYKKPIGRVAILEKTSGFVLLKAPPKYLTNLIAENPPRGVVKKMEIGITNINRKGAGTIGVRLTDSDKYGPTAENFESTNIAGRVRKGEDALARCKKGDSIYLKRAG